MPTVEAGGIIMPTVVAANGSGWCCANGSGWCFYRANGSGWKRAKPGMPIPLAGGSSCQR